LPKICGNIALRYRSAIALPSLLCAAACSPDPEPDRTFEVTVHELVGCPLPADLAGVGLELEALGDFPASNRTAELIAADASQTLAFPEATRAIVATATAAGGTQWIGVDDRRGDDRVDLLLWREELACPLFFPQDGAEYPSLLGGQALGGSHTLGWALVAGGVFQSDRDPGLGALLFDVRRGTMRALTARGETLNTPRAFATVTEFGGGLVVAGGEGADGPVADAEVFDFASGHYTDIIGLSEGRTRHAAVVLDTGETLLVGGQDARRQPLETLQLISPKLGRTILAGLATLENGRIAPQVLRLSDGRLFVAGGLDADESPISPVEWLTPDASQHVKTLDPDGETQQRCDRAFVAMPGGAVLGVGGCVRRVPAPSESCGDCREGFCPPLDGSTPRFDAVWISSEGTVYPFPIDVVAPRPILVSASDGRPFLFADGKLWRFDPWRTGFDLVSDEVLLPSGDLPAPLPLDPGAFVWLAEGEQGLAEVWGLRHGTRNRFSRDVVLLADPLDLEHVAPDRPPGNGVSFGGALELDFAAVHVTDTTYEDVSLEIVLLGGPPPRVIFTVATLGVVECSWPDSPPAPPETLQVSRTANGATLIRGAAVTHCAVETGRASVGLRGTSGMLPSRIGQLSIRRGLP
jgi:hypothetical protein